MSKIKKTGNLLWKIIGGLAIIITIISGLLQIIGVINFTLPLYTLLMSNIPVYCTIFFMVVSLTTCYIIRYIIIKRKTSNILDEPDGRNIAVLCQTPRTIEFLKQQYRHWQSKRDWVFLGGYSFDDYMKQLEKQGYIQYVNNTWIVKKEALDYIQKYHGS